MKRDSLAEDGSAAKGAGKKPKSGADLIGA